MRWMFFKDLKILKRSPAMLGLLVLYPILISALIGLALSREPAKPRVAFVSGKANSLSIGNEKVSTVKDVRSLLKSIELIEVKDRQEALKAVQDGKVIAAIIVPPGIEKELSLGLKQPELELIYNVRDPVKAQAVEETFKSGIADVNAELSRRFTDVAKRYLGLIVAGGQIDVFGQKFDVLGLKKAEVAVERASRKLPKNSKERKELEQVANFAQIAIDNLDLSDNVLASVGQPIKFKKVSLSGDHAPLDTFAVAVAVTVTLMFIGVLLGAGMLALEGEENTYLRLTRGLVAKSKLVVVKSVLAAACAATAGLIMIAGITLFLPLAWGQFALWGTAVLLGSAAFATFGVALGALAKEVRTASLLTVLLTLPLAFLALVPDGSVSGPLYSLIATVSALFPFKETEAIVSTGLAATDTSAVAGSFLHLLALVVGYGIVARLALRRFS